MSCVQTVHTIKEQLEALQNKREKLEADHIKIMKDLSQQRTQKVTLQDKNFQTKAQHIQSDHDEQFTLKTKLVNGLRQNIQAMYSCLDTALIQRAKALQHYEEIDLSKLELLMQQIEAESSRGLNAFRSEKKVSKRQRALMLEYLRLAFSYVYTLEYQITKLKTNLESQNKALQSQKKQMEDLIASWYVDACSEENKRYKDAVLKNDKEISALLTSNLCSNYEKMFVEEISRKGLHQEDWTSKTGGNYHPHIEEAGFLLGMFYDQNRKIRSELWNRLSRAIPSAVEATSFKLPLCMPHRTCLRFFVQYDNLSKDRMSQYIQYILLQKLRCSVLENIRVCFFDFNDSGSRLGVLSAMSEDNEAINIHTVNSKNEITTELASLCQHINQVIAGLGEKDFYQYNAEKIRNRQYPLLNETILVIHDVDTTVGGDAWDFLRTIWNNAHKSGVSILLTSSRSIDELDSLRLHHNIDLSFLKNDKKAFYFSFTPSSITIQNSNRRLLLSPCEIKPYHRDFVTEYRSLYSKNQQIEGDFEKIFPKFDSLQLWDATTGIKIEPMTENRPHGQLTAMTLGVGKCVHTLITGATDSGKSVFLHTIIYSVLMRYKPSDVQIWLVDYAKTEFSRYIYHPVPHIKAVMLENDPDFSVSILQKIKAVYEDRKREFYKCQVTDSEMHREYCRKNNRPIMPRILFIIDEFHVMSEHLYNKGMESEFENLLKECRKTGISFVFADQDCRDIKISMSQVQNTIAMGGHIDSVMQTMAGRDSSRFISSNRDRINKMTQGQLVWWSPVSQEISFYQGINSKTIDYAKFLDRIAARSDCAAFPCEDKIIVDSKELEPFNPAKCVEYLKDRTDPNKRIVFLGTPNTIDPYVSMSLTYQRPRQNVIIYGINERTVDYYYHIVRSAIKSLRMQGTKTVILGKAKYPETREIVKRDIDKLVDLFITDGDHARRFLNETWSSIENDDSADQNLAIFWCDYNDLRNDLEKTVNNNPPKSDKDLDLKALLGDSPLVNSEFYSNLGLKNTTLDFSMTTLIKLIESGSLNGVYQFFSFASPEDLRKLKDVKNLHIDNCEHNLVLFPMDVDVISSFGLTISFKKSNEEGYAVLNQYGTRKYFRPYIHNGFQEDNMS